MKSFVFLAMGLLIGALSVFFVLKGSQENVLETAIRQEDESSHLGKVGGRLPPENINVGEMREQEKKVIDSGELSKRIARGPFGDFAIDQGLSESEVLELVDVLERHASEARDLAIDDDTGVPAPPSLEDFKGLMSRRDSELKKILGKQEFQSFKEYSMTLPFRGVAESLSDQGLISLDGETRREIFRDLSSQLPQMRDYNSPEQFEAALVGSLSTASQGHLSDDDRNSLVDGVQKMIDTRSQRKQMPGLK